MAKGAGEARAIKMRDFHPDNLREGKGYQFVYLNAEGKYVTDIGTFTHMDVGQCDKKELWLWFEHDDATFDVPYSAASILAVDELC